jgi:hypothetical protein
MAHRESLPVVVIADVSGFDGLMRKLSTSLTTINALQQVLRRNGTRLQQRAVHNVSGNVVSYKGRTWVVNRQTGKLARSIQQMSPAPLSVAVVASAEYASDVIEGTRGPIDLKRFLAGKIIPLPLSNAQGKAVNKGGIKTLFVGRFSNTQTAASGIKKNTMTSSGGKSMGSKYVMFRRVPKVGGKGWIIPQRPPRPFLQEAADYVAPMLAEDVENAFKAFLEGDAS